MSGASILSAAVMLLSTQYPAGTKTLARILPHTFSEWDETLSSIECAQLRPLVLFLAMLLTLLKSFPFSSSYC